MTDIASLAASLTKVQKGWLLGAFYGRSGWRIERHSKKACALGLCFTGSSLLTPLGQQLRAYLMENRNG